MGSGNTSLLTWKIKTHLSNTINAITALMPWQCQESGHQQLYWSNSPTILQSKQWKGELIDLGRYDCIFKNIIFKEKSRLISSVFYIKWPWINTRGLQVKHIISAQLLYGLHFVLFCCGPVPTDFTHILQANFTGGLVITPMPVKQLWRIWVNESQVCKQNWYYNHKTK